MTMDRPPRNAFEPGNQAWRQWVEESVAMFRKRLDQRLGNDVTNSFKATTSSLGYLNRQDKAIKEAQNQIDAAVADIAAQQAYLGRLVTLAAQGDDVSTSDNSGSLIISGETDPHVELELDVEMKCKISLRGTGRISVGSSVPKFNSGRIITAVRVDGTELPGGQGSFYASSNDFGSASGGGIETEGLIEAQVIIDLGPGTFDISGYYAFRGNNGGSSLIEVQSPTLIVEVIGLP